MCDPRFFFFNDTATTEIYTLSLHDALPIFSRQVGVWTVNVSVSCTVPRSTGADTRSEEHTSELQSQSNLVCRLLLEKKKTSAVRACRPHLARGNLAQNKPRGAAHGASLRPP